LSSSDFRRRLGIQQRCFRRLLHLPERFEDYTHSDDHRLLREGGEIYEVDTISLVELLDKYEAPRTID
jgi:hypothetical protein